MSGIGEVLAIVSCVAGLIQAYDAGARIFKQMKARRQAHGALPPSSLLEESIEQGKRDIQKLIAEGTKRFGPSFEEGDTTAKLALYQITIQTQNALLEGLTAARDDDGIVDFDAVIDLSDQGRHEALLALHLLFQRKLEEEMSRKRTVAVQVEEAKRERTAAQALAVQTQQPPPPAMSPPTASEMSPTSLSSPLSLSSPSSSFSSQTRMSRISTHFRRTSSIDSQKRQSPTPATATPQAHRGSLGTLDLKLQPTALASDDATAPDDSSWKRKMSRASTAVSTMTSPHNETCEYAYKVRLKGANGGLQLQSFGFYDLRMVYKCKRRTCAFESPAVHTRKGWEFDTTIKRCFGLQYRWLFLAKSHVAHPQKTSRPPYLCLICLLLTNESKIHEGHEELFSHIDSHEERSLGGVSLEGPLAFTTEGVKAVENFDLLLPKLQRPLPTPLPGRGAPTGRATGTQNGMHQVDRQFKGVSLASSDDEISPAPMEPALMPTTARTHARLDFTSHLTHSDPNFNPWS